MTISMKDIAEAAAVLRELRDIELMDATPRHFLAIQSRARRALSSINGYLSTVPVSVTEDK